MTDIASNLHSERSRSDGRQYTHRRSRSEVAGEANPFRLPSDELIFSFKFQEQERKV